MQRGCFIYIPLCDVYCGATTHRVSIARRCSRRETVEEYRLLRRYRAPASWYLTIFCYRKTFFATVVSIATLRYGSISLKQFVIAVQYTRS